MSNSGKKNESYGNPTNNEEGYNILVDMNQHHKPMADWAFQHIEINSNDIVLEVGCGGGANIKRIATIAKLVTGIDISEMSIKVSKEVNEELIKNNRVKVFQTSVEDYKAPDASYSLVTAFSTIYFWKDRKKAFSNIFDSLKRNGFFKIIMSGIETMSKWTSVPGLKLVDQYELLKELVEAGFNEVKITRNPNENWLVVSAHKI
ncbi:class I SAM-dependent methyltransferase [Ureaplasma sp. ES3154-GEN]|uniref:class I SAM-dependent methyltransferase n=1 Tax=Ureaplasma sp. ES3154-GEN TaxID=2984844 RepID=UPI0021E8AFF7|nr:class I SAM-dependent methyltransferase [Ureaplasma sp. ES3154-GEN]MCV3743781.1 class I SAM-dependent methyltransferase [Ureaplasma sp. ES3154-GEN]